MTYGVEVRRSAELDIAEAQIRYEELRDGLGDEFILEVDRLLGRLAESPLIYQKAYGDARKAQLKRFPYLIWYRIVDRVVQVLAVTDGREDPQRAHGRLS